MATALALFAELVSPANAASAPASAEARTVVEWTFDRGGDTEGWVANGHLQDVTVTNGMLIGTAVGTDPILEFRPPLDLKATPWNVIELRLKADRDGAAEFFWSNTAEGRFGGFAQEKTTRFNVTGDSQWRVYRLMPFWQPEGKIVRLRLDVYDGAKFEIDSIRIRELAMPAASDRPEFDFTKGVQGWQPLNGAQLTPRSGGMEVTLPAADSLVLGPPVALDAEVQSFVSIRMSAMKGQRGLLHFATDKTSGLHSLSFPIDADGREHTYNLDLLAAREWKGRIIALGLQPGDPGNAAAQVRWLRVGSEPQGPPELKLISFAPEDALPRAGVATRLSAIVSNRGGDPATNVQGILKLPAGVEILSAAPTGSRLPSVGFSEEAVLSWNVRSRKPVDADIELRLTWGGSESAGSNLSLTQRTRIAFTPRLAVPDTGYVPEPKPIRGPFEVGVYYFPGWKTASQWQPVTRFPERKPVLGWYREGDPEIADWHIKWAVEHGITYFAYDWYWSRGSRQLEHALHDGFFKARYRSQLKFCLLWANHNPPKSSSREDCLAVTRYWIENYFRRPEHLTVDGKPVMIIFSPHRLTEDLGSAGVKEAFQAMRQECVAAGLKGLHLIACVGEVGGARQAAAEGYDAVTAYNWPHLGMTGGGMYGPFDTLVDGYRRQWQHFIEQSPIPLEPLPVCGGWDSRPWHGDNNLVRFGRTPELFARHLRDARTSLESNRSASSTTNRMILIEAWNEWGEGSYIEPHQEFGFGYLDAIRDVFTAAPKAHDDVTPADAGRGPYEVPAGEPSRTAWDFARDLGGWAALMGLSELQLEGGSLQSRTTSNDPALTSPPLQAQVSGFSMIVVRMKLRQSDGQPFNDAAQLFWSTSRLAESEASSVRFNVTGDGEWHDYRVPVGANNRWRGVITRLRLDPCNRPGIDVRIESIRMEPMAAGATNPR